MLIHTMVPGTNDVGSRVDNEITSRRTGRDRYGIQMLAIQMR